MNTLLMVLLCCGFAAVMCTVRIVKENQKCGVEASPNLIHRNPWMVFLEYYRRGHLTEVRCGGTLVHSRYVLTAAHCIKHPKFSNLMARLGDYNVDTKDDVVDGVHADPVQRLQVVKTVIHPQYDGREHDIAILKLNTDAPYTDFIRPVCLPSEGLNDDSTLYAAGWGEIPTKGYYSEVKKIIPLPHVPVAQCKKSYSSKLPESVICAGGQEGIDTCRGDSGGPLTLNRERVELWGVTSLGNSRCGEEGKPGIYTNVADYIEWINEVIDGDARK